MEVDLPTQGCRIQACQKWFKGTSTDLRLSICFDPWNESGVFHFDDISLMRISTDPTALGTNLITNGDFSSWDDYWSRWRNKSVGCSWSSSWDSGSMDFDIVNGG